MRRSSENGYSLIEVLVGLAIFSVGALASGMMIVASMHQNQQARERTRVAGLVSERLEELRSRPWEDAGGYNSLRSGGQVLDVEELRNYSYGMTEYDFSGAYDSNLYEIGMPYDEMPFYLVMWRIEDMTDSGLDFKRVTIRGAAMRWHSLEQRWEPVATFDHVGMIFREIKAE